jgi:signal transduction histidine kinase
MRGSLLIFPGLVWGATPYIAPLLLTCQVVFSYSVSHDLRAPLRAIDGFSRILLEEHMPHLAPEAQRYLHLIRNNAKQMDQLIDNLLAFSRLSRQPLTKQPIMPADLVRRVLSDIRSALEGRRIDIELGDLPEFIPVKSSIARG